MDERFVLICVSLMTENMEKEGRLRGDAGSRGREGRGRPRKKDPETMCICSNSSGWMYLLLITNTFIF